METEASNLLVDWKPTIARAADAARSLVQQRHELSPCAGVPHPIAALHYCSAALTEAVLRAKVYYDCGPEWDASQEGVNTFEFFYPGGLPADQWVSASIPPLAFANLKAVNS
jgi:hypothetical protein